ncbi:MAG: hypothetical protein HGA31_02785 [Candidatus Moranbacteria bacterium]|nr:hypothetical protein [Candidatus Moranbacteria bacterium]
MPKTFFQIFFEHFTKKTHEKRHPHHLHPLLEHSDLKRPGDDGDKSYVSFKIDPDIDKMKHKIERKWFPKIYMTVTESGAIVEIKPPQLNFSDGLFRTILIKIFTDRFKALKSDVATVRAELDEGPPNDKPRMILTLTSTDLENFERILENAESTLFGFCEIWREIYHFRADYEEEIRIAHELIELKIQKQVTDIVRSRRSKKS